MILRAASGWQTVTADLALILFLITAQAVREPSATPSQEETEVEAETDAAEPAPVTSSALALHKPAPGESVQEWLRATVTDERQVATISIGYAPGQREEALAEGERLLGEAEAAGVAARLIAMPNSSDDILVSVDYLRPAPDGTNLAP
jgi:alanine racemase